MVKISIFCAAWTVRLGCGASFCRVCRLDFVSISVHANVDLAQDLLLDGGSDRVGLDGWVEMAWGVFLRVR